MDYPQVGFYGLLGSGHSLVRMRAQRGIHRKSLTSPWRLSISVCAMNTSFASLPFLISLASGSVVLRWVALVSFSPRKSPDWLPPLPSLLDSSSSSRCLKLFMLAAASISVPSTLKCSSDIRPRLSASYATSSNSFLSLLVPLFGRQREQWTVAKAQAFVKAM